MKKILVSTLLSEGECEVETIWGRKTHIYMRRLEDKKTCCFTKPQYHLGLQYNDSFHHVIQKWPWSHYIEIYVYPPNVGPYEVIPNVAEMADYTIVGNYDSIRVYTHS